MDQPLKRFIQLTKDRVELAEIAPLTNLNDHGKAIRHDALANKKGRAVGPPRG
ncbi:MAG TPA: hypothetical protein VNY08_05835 [Bradyrhizobium sp.]|nr:hypothetical protein [Bradyrhizobium sp.]